MNVTFDPASDTEIILEMIEMANEMLEQQDKWLRETETHDTPASERDHVHP